MVGCMDELLERNKNLNRGFRKLRVWQEAIDLYVFVKERLEEISGISFKIRGIRSSIQRFLFLRTWQKGIVAGRLKSIYSL